MGYRLHFCTEYVKKYSNDSRFNHNTEVINNLFQWLNDRNDHCGEFTCNGDSLDSADELEWTRDGVFDAMALVKEMVDHGKSWADIPEYNDDAGDWSMDKWLRNRLIKAEQEDGITPEYVYTFLRKAFSEAEPNDNVIHFDWF